MTDTQTVKANPTTQAQHQPEHENVLLPAVDIYEEARGITVKADLPGVSHDSLDVQVNGNNLIIEGQAVIDIPQELEALYTDVNTSHFRRSFSLSNELEPDKISAEINNGVLTLFIPKRAELQPRKIKVSSN